MNVEPTVIAPSASGAPLQASGSRHEDIRMGSSFATLDDFFASISTSQEPTSVTEPSHVPMDQLFATGPAESGVSTSDDANYPAFELDNSDVIAPLNPQDVLDDLYDDFGDDVPLVTDEDLNDFLYTEECYAHLQAGTMAAPGDNEGTHEVDLSSTSAELASSDVKDIPEGAANDDRTVDVANILLDLYNSAPVTSAVSCETPPSTFAELAGLQIGGDLEFSTDSTTEEPAVPPVAETADVPVIAVSQVDIAPVPTVEGQVVPNTPEPVEVVIASTVDAERHTVRADAAIQVASGRMYSDTAVQTEVLEVPEVTGTAEVSDAVTQTEEAAKPVAHSSSKSDACVSTEDLPSHQALPVVPVDVPRMPDSRQFMRRIRRPHGVTAVPSSFMAAGGPLVLRCAQCSRCLRYGRCSSARQPGPPLSVPCVPSAPSRPEEQRSSVPPPPPPPPPAPPIQPRPSPAAYGLFYGMPPLTSTNPRKPSSRAFDTWSPDLTSHPPNRQVCSIWLI